MARKKKDKYMGASGGFKTITLMKNCTIHGVLRKAGTQLTVTPEKLKELHEGGFLTAPKLPPDSSGVKKKPQPQKRTHDQLPSVSTDGKKKTTG